MPWDVPSIDSFDVDLAAERAALPSLNSRQRAALPGVTDEAMLRAGGLCWARVEVTGRLFRPSTAGSIAIVQGVWDGPAPSIYAVNDAPPADLIAWTAAAPETWVYRIGAENLVLGHDVLADAHRAECLPLFSRTPLEWLQSGCKEVCLLNWCERMWGGA